MTSAEVEIAVANYYRLKGSYLVVPNITWGLGFRYEVDLLAMSTTGYLTEIEIKVSAADLRADKKKRHQHDDRRLKAVYFAVPEGLQRQAEAQLDPAWGIMVVDDRPPTWGPAMGDWRLERAARVARAAQTNRLAPALGPEEQFKLARLGAVRLWSLKEKVFAAHNPRTENG